MEAPLIPDATVERAARRLKVIGEPVRLRLLNEMQRHDELSVQALVDATGQRQANVSKHLGVLAREGLVARRREGVSVFYSIAEPSLRGLCLLLTNSLPEASEDGSEGDEAVSHRRGKAA